MRFARLAPLAFLCVAPLSTACSDHEPAAGGSSLPDAASPEGDSLAGEDASDLDATHDEDAGPTDAAAPPDADPPAPALVSVFVAQGYMGRTIVSCDRGETWVGDRSDDDAMRCFAGVDCDHNGGRAMGVTFGAGRFVATWGWGKGDSIRRSADGVTWDEVTEGTVFSGVRFAGDRFVAISGSPRVSTDGGATWTSSGSIGFEGHVRSTGASDFGGGRFVAAGSVNGASVGEVMLSADGVSWKRPKSMPSACGLAVGWNSIASGGGVSVIVSDDGTVCRSADGGDTWTKHALGGKLDDSVVHDGARFLAFGTDGGGKRVAFESEDGATWTAKALTLTRPDGSKGVPSLGAVAYGDGRFVAVNGGWNQWYEKQVFFRSDDGVAWTQLPASAYRGGHPIVMIAHGRVEEPSVCK